MPLRGLDLQHLRQLLLLLLLLLHLWHLLPHNMPLKINNLHRAHIPLLVHILLPQIIRHTLDGVLLLLGVPLHLLGEDMLLRAGAQRRLGILQTVPLRLGELHLLNHGVHLLPAVPLLGEHPPPTQPLHHGVLLKLLAQRLLGEAILQLRHQHLLHLPSLLDRGTFTMDKCKEE